jgi:hypothetical protein
VEILVQQTLEEVEEELGYKQVLLQWEELEVQGIVIVRYPNTYTITVGAGLTSSTATDGSDKVTTFTAGTDTISFS